ncbi:MAG: hypothetical protein DRP83_00930 [Planctomycetota bacterium]|nr:MAG: hypothetical protein DRP83_00930 [Planctomycetota bacterium]
MAENNNDHLRPHCDTWICGKCRKEIKKGHRVMQVFIALGKGHNPSNVMEVGMNLAPEWELVHVNCNDPLLTKGIKA